MSLIQRFLVKIFNIIMVSAMTSTQPDNISIRMSTKPFLINQSCIEHCGGNIFSPKEIQLMNVKFAHGHALRASSHFSHALTPKKN